MPKKDPVDTGVGLIELRLGASLTCPTKRLVADLSALALFCARARTAMVRAFERWHEDNPGWNPGVVLKKDGTPAIDKHGRPRVKNQPLPEKMGEDEIGPSTWLYRAGRKAVPEASSNLLSTCAQKVWGHLTDNMPYNHHGTSLYRWQAIINYEAGWSEVDRTVYRSPVIPVPNGDSFLCYLGKLSGNPSAIVAQRVRACGESSAVVRFPMWSRLAGRKVVDAICRVEVRQLSPGNRDVLRRIATGEWKMRDSQLVYKEGKSKGRRRSAKRNGAWVLQLAYHQPRELLGLDTDRVAVLRAHIGGKAQPFYAMTPESYQRHLPRFVAQTLEKEFGRLEDRRRYLRQRYPLAGSGRKGHGRQRHERDLRPITRKLHDLSELFAKHLVSEIITFCRQTNCGSILYLEPTIPARASSWFASKDVCFDWTSFLTRLKQKCHHHGIVVDVERMKKRA